MDYIRAFRFDIFYKLPRRFLWTKAVFVKNSGVKPMSVYVFFCSYSYGVFTAYGRFPAVGDKAFVPLLNQGIVYI